MTYEPKTEAGKEALAQGADPKVVESMEQDGELGDAGKTTEEQHVNKETDEGAGDGADKGKDGQAAAGQDGKGKEGEGDAGKQPNRPVQSIPVWKANEMAKKAAEDAARETTERLTADFQAKLKEAGGKEGGASGDDVQKIADEFGIRVELVPALIERIGGEVAKNLKTQVLSDEDRRALDAAKERSTAALEQEGFEKEFSSPEVQEALKQASGGKDVPATAKEKVRELAYTEGYNRYRLVDIVKLEQRSIFPSGSISAEPGKGGLGRGRAEVKSIDDLTPDEILNMPADEFQAFSDRIGKGNRFQVRSAPAKERK